jgi:hypothetical protein
MTLPDLDPTRSPELLFGDIVTYVTKATAMIEARDTVSLVGLDTSIEAMCQRILELPPETAREYGPELAHLVQAIDGLRGKMLLLQNEMATTIKSLSTQKKASQAYKNTPTTQSEE